MHKLCETLQTKMMLYFPPIGNSKSREKPFSSRLMDTLEGKMVVYILPSLGYMLQVTVGYDSQLLSEHNCHSLELLN